MNQEQIVGALRIIVPGIFAWLAAKGLTIFADETFVTQVIALISGIVAVAWSVMSHTNANKLKMAAAIDPKIEIVVPHAVAAADPRIAAVATDPAVPNVRSTKPLPEKVPPQ